MIRSKFFSRFIVVTLTAALLLITGSRAISVSALADPVQAVAPIYDTQIYQLQDYIENGGMTGSQLDIFYTLAGFYVLGQAGSAGYKLVDPYANSDSVWDWLKSCGIEIYNTVIGLIPDTARMPITGQIYSTIPFKKASQLYVATLMGAATKAATYASYEDFKDEVINSQSYWLPWNLDVQKGMNSIFGIYNGIYQWQFDNKPFESTATYFTRPYSNLILSNYNTIVESMVHPVRANYNRTVNTTPAYCMLSDARFDTYHNIFVDTDDSYIRFVDDAGNSISGTGGDLVWITNDIYHDTSPGFQFTFLQTNFNANNYSNYLELVKAFYNFEILPQASSSYYPYLNLFYEDFVQHIYVGTNWLNKTELFNLTDLNFDENDQTFYEAVPEEHDYLFDIKGILSDILNETDLTNIFLNNLIDIDGVPVHDEDLIRITTDIYELLSETTPILPVNLNDIADYSDNTYLDMVKERATAAGSTLANLVAFWHNCDFELVYVLFGAGITVLIGAFIGKWGHS